MAGRAPGTRTFRKEGPEADGVSDDAGRDRDLTAPRALRDYAVLADGERGAIVGPQGEIVWMCAPRWDCDAVFARLIGGEGSYSVTPAARFVWGGYYEEGTLIWRSRWVTDEGVIECREALALPGDPHRAVLLRSITPGDAPARLRVSLEPRGARRPRRRVAGHRDGVGAGRAAARRHGRPA